MKSDFFKKKYYYFNVFLKRKKIVTIILNTINIEYKSFIFFPKGAFLSIQNKEENILF